MPIVEITAQDTPKKLIKKGYKALIKSGHKGKAKVLWGKGKYAGFLDALQILATYCKVSINGKVYN